MRKSQRLERITCFEVTPDTYGWVVSTDERRVILGTFPTKQAAKEAAKLLAATHLPSRIKVFTKRPRK
jgi:hypothetical protein